MASSINRRQFGRPETIFAGCRTIEQNGHQVAREFANISLNVIMANNLIAGDWLTIHGVLKREINDIENGLEKK